MTKDEALKLALEALEDLGMKHFDNTGEVLYKETFTAIKEALAQREQLQPVWSGGPTNKDYEDAMRLRRINELAAPPQRTWVGLTDIDYAGLPLEQVGLVRWAEAKLKEKNT